MHRPMHRPMHRTRRRTAACLVLAGALLAPAPGARAQDAGPVDLELVLAVDSSGSIDAEERQLQRAGWAGAIMSARVLGAIRSGPHGAIAVTLLEWAAVGCETVAVPWTRIANAADARRFAEGVLKAPTLDCWGGNAIGDALAFAAGLLHGNAYDGTRLVIDVSGDGPANLGRPVVPARDAVVASGITINGLAIINPGRTYPGPGGMPLDQHYRRDVTGGPGSFVMTAKSDHTFRSAVLAKLVREIAGRAAPPAPGLAAARDPER